MADPKLPPVPPPPQPPTNSPQPPKDPPAADSAAQPQAPAFKLAKGVDVTYFQLQNGGTVQAFRGKVTAVCPVAAGALALERVDLEFQGALGKRFASEIRRGRGALDAPCWTPLAS